MTCEKKTVRLHLSRQLCVSESMAKEIHARAERGFRSVEDEIRWLIHLGFMLEDELYGDERTASRLARLVYRGVKITVPREGKHGH